MAGEEENDQGNKRRRISLSVFPRGEFACLLEQKRNSKENEEGYNNTPRLKEKEEETTTVGEKNGNLCTWQQLNFLFSGFAFGFPFPNELNKHKHPGITKKSSHSREIQAHGNHYFSRFKVGCISKIDRPFSYLKDCEQRDGEAVEVWWRRPVREVEGAAKELHAEQREDEDEEEEEEQKGDDGTHRTQEGDHKVAQGRPISGKKEGKLQKKSSLGKNGL